MPSDRLRASLLQSYQSARERDLFRALLELNVTDVDVWKAFDNRGLRLALHEPGKESDLRKPVKNYLKDEWGLNRIAAEVPLPSKSMRGATKADIVGFRKKDARGQAGLRCRTEI